MKRKRSKSIIVGTILVSAKAHRPPRLLQLVREVLGKRESVTLCALEKAMVLALDVTRVVTTTHEEGSPILATLAGLQTSYEEVADKVTGLMVRRSKVKCVLRRSADYERLLQGGTV